MYKLIGEDDDLFMLEHKADGKQFSVAKKSISKNLHDKVRAYSKGGVVEPKDEGFGASSLKTYGSAPDTLPKANTQKPIPAVFDYKKQYGNQQNVKGYAQGGEVRDPSLDQFLGNGQDFNNQQEIPALISNQTGGAPDTYNTDMNYLLSGNNQNAPMTPGQLASSSSPQVANEFENMSSFPLARAQEQANPQAKPPSTLSGIRAYLDAQTDLKPAVQDPVMGAVMGNNANGAFSPKAAQPSQVAGPSGLTDQLSSIQTPLKEAVGKNIAATTGVQELLTGKDGNGGVYGDMSKTLGQIEKDRAATFNKLNAEYEEEAKKYSDSKIDQFRLWNSVSPGSKIGGIAAILVGGLSQGLTGKDNPALTMLNSFIDKDIAAQRTELDKGKNLLAFNMRRFQNLEAATAATRAAMLAQSEAKIKGVMSKMLAPQAAMQGAEAISQLEMQRLALTRQVAIYDAIDKASGGSNGGGGAGNLSPSQLQILGLENRAIKSPEIQWNTATGKEVKTPSFTGVARTPDDAQKIKAAGESVVNVKAALDAAIAFEKQHQGLEHGTFNLGPFSSDTRNQANTLTEALRAALGDYADKTGNAAFKQSASAIGQLGTTLGGGQLKSLYALIPQLKAHYESVLSGRGYNANTPNK